MARSSSALLSVLVGIGFVLACGDPRALLEEQPATSGGAPAPGGGATDGGAAGILPTAAAAAPTPSATHRVLGVLDPERDNMAAFALKVPVGWKVEQSFTRKWDGAVPLAQVSLRLAAPDGRSEIRYRPIVTHLWSEGPLTNQLRAQKASFGMDPRISENELEPISGSAYARRYLVGMFAQDGFVLGDLRNDQDAPDERVSATQTSRRGWVDGTLPDGRVARVEARIRIDRQEVQGDMSYPWSVVPSLTIAGGDLEATYAHTRTAQDSIVTNPAWTALEAETQSRGYQANREVSQRQHEATMRSIRANTEAMTAGHNARMQAIQAAGDASTQRYQERMQAMDQDMAAWQGRQASSDQQQAYTIDTIRGEHRYADPTTGQQYTVQDGAKHVYRDTTGQNVILSTSAPLDPQQVDWQELQRLTQSEY